MTTPDSPHAPRRNFMIGGMSAAAAIGLAAPTASAYGGGTTVSGVFDVTQPPYSVANDGTASASTGIQAAIDDAAEDGGGIVWLPHGIYHLAAQLVIPAQVVLKGAGWDIPQIDIDGVPHNSPGNGTWLTVSSTAFTPILVSGRGARISGIAFSHVQATQISGTWAPAGYPFAIEINGTDVTVENVFLRNATRGIHIRGRVDEPGTGHRAAVGRVTLKGVRGQPLIEGVRIDNALDVIRVSDVHFWPFWSNSAIVRNFQASNACYGFVLSRVDNPIFDSVFVFGYRRAFYFTKSVGPASTLPSTSGYTSRFMISNCGADFCGQGIHIDGAGTSGMVSNFSALGGPSGVNGVHVAATALLQMSNVRFTAFNTNAIRVEGTSTQVSVDNVLAELWNQSGLGFPAIGGVAPAKVLIGHCRMFVGSGVQIGSTLTGDTATFVVDG